MDSAELRLNDAITFLGWLPGDDLPEHIRESLQQADAKLRAKEFIAAHDLCWQAINQVSPNSLSETIHSSAGHARVHLGAVNYARGDGFLDDAVEAFTIASKELNSRHRAQAVAEFALGATYAWKGERSKVYEHITPEVLGTLKWYPAAKEADQKWAEILGRLGANPASIPPPSTPAPPVANSEPLPDYSEPWRPLPDIPRGGDVPWWYRALIYAALFVVVVGSAALVFVLSRSLLGVIVYLVVLPSATYLVINRLKYSVQQDQALVIEAGGAPKVCWGPGTYYRWPFNEQFRAIVPLAPLRYTSPSRTVKVKPDKSVTIQLQVYYRVEADGGNEQSVIDSVYRTQLAGRGSESRSGAQRSSKLLTSRDLQGIWEKFLLQDITAALSRVLPGVTYEQLAGKPVSDRKEIEKRLRVSLTHRVSVWGMTIEEVSIADVTENKP